MGVAQLEAESKVLDCRFIFRTCFQILPKTLCILELIALLNYLFNIKAACYGIYDLITRHMGTVSASSFREVRHQMPFASIHMN